MYHHKIFLHCIKTYGILIVMLLHAPFLVALVMYERNPI